MNDLNIRPDKVYGSWLFHQERYCDLSGGPAVDPSIRLNGFEHCKPDYDLYPIEYSLGYTWPWCPRHCPFCIVPKQNNPREHHSIWEFHDTRFNKICLLNNNTFSDPQWRETFEEIWDADLTVHDENGYDIRLLDDEKAEALKKTKFDGYIHFAWDLMSDWREVMRGLYIARQHKLSGMVYILIGCGTSRDADLFRCQVVSDMKMDPYPMPYNRGSKEDRAFKRFICLRGYRKYKSIYVAWKDYKG